MIKHHDQKQLWEERVYFILHFQVAVHYWGKSGWELKTGMCKQEGCRVRKGMVFTVLVLMALSPCSLCSSLPQTTYSWMAPTPSHINHESRICTIGLLTDQSGGGIFLIYCVPSSQMTVACIKLYLFICVYLLNLYYKVGEFLWNIWHTVVKLLCGVDLVIFD